MSFKTLGLCDELIRAVAEQGYDNPTPIQSQAIPAVLTGNDLLAGAQTGTGKTAGFVLPLLQRLIAIKNQTEKDSPEPQGKKLTGRSSRKPLRALILTPTRELAAQVNESVQTYGKYLTHNSAVIYGGVSINPQISLLKRGVDILTATPGRLLDLHQQQAVEFSKVEILVLDEADRMLDMGFIRDIRRILSLLPKKRQSLLFSATFSNEIKQLADDLLDSPAMIEVAKRNSTVEAIEQKVHPVDKGRKCELLVHLIKTKNWRQVLVFTRTKHGANKLVDQLGDNGITALAIHGNKSQGARLRALSEFKDNSVQVLVATDIAARGIDIDLLPHVVNYDLPNVPEDYVHRIGRTGRAGASGEAVSLVCIDDKDFLVDIEKLIRRQLPKEIIAGFEVNPNIRAEPVVVRQQRHSVRTNVQPKAKSGNESRGNNRNQNLSKNTGVQVNKTSSTNDVHKTKRPKNINGNRPPSVSSQGNTQQPIGQFAAAVARGDYIVTPRNDSRSKSSPKPSGNATTNRNKKTKKNWDNV